VLDKVSPRSLVHEPLPNKKYQVIYTDPPWEQTKGNKRKVRPNQEKSLDYKTLSMTEIQEIHRNYSDRTELKHNFFMWTIDKFLHQSEQMMKELGYILHARLVWDKQNGIAPAFTIRFSHEYLLWFYKKGNILMPCEEMRGKQTTVIREKSTKHSKKPIAVYEMIEIMFPKSTKIELFARNTRDGWDSWGNEV
jgi:N6-adenosine-specific RNA methylase IME4